MVQPKEDVYKRMARRIGYPRSKALRGAFKIWCTPEEGEVWLELARMAPPLGEKPPAPVFAEDIAKTLNRDKSVVEEQIESLFQKGLTNEIKRPDGTVYHTAVTSCEPISNAVGYLFGTRDWDDKTRSWRNKWVADILDRMQDFEHNDWWRWQRVDELVNRQVTFTILPAYTALLKSNAELPYPEWCHAGLMAQRAESLGKSILARPCICRVRMREKNCTLPVWTCVPIVEDDKMYGLPLTPDDRRVTSTPERRGQFRRLAPEEFLEIFRHAEEDLNAVHIGLPNGSYFCTCCNDCCDWLTPVLKYSKEPSEAVDPSPYRSVVNKGLCQGCVEDCVPRCRFKAIKGQTDRSSGKVQAAVDLKRCVGCGQCVLGCKVDSAIKLELATKLGNPPPIWDNRLTGALA
ncbi:MAG: hypothetical protein HYX83_00985 [Chloroflexi bacterium]|nr:hypothetical protein [Chloroflexota bacterium]